MKKLLAVLLALLLCVSYGELAFAQDDWTILVYICGADLESEAACATDNMQAMLDARTGANIRYVVQTGGAAAWNNGADPDELDRFLITEGSSAIVDRQPLASMGEPETLAAFIRWGLAAYPAAHTGLVLWDHGSGSINGVCFDELDDDNSLTLRDLDTALGGTAGLLPGGFDFIGFDACLMSTVETAAILAPYAKCMVASQEIEPGSGWDYEAIGRFLNVNPGADAAALGTAICDSYYANCIACESEDIATLALVDLSKIGALQSAFDAYAKNLFEATEVDADFAPIARSIAAAENFGGNNRSEGYTNMVDLGALIGAGEDWSENARAARSALDDAVVYSVRGSNHRQASGLSVYYPLSVQGSMELGIFRDICPSSYYLSLVDKIAYGYASGGDWDSYDSDTDWDFDAMTQDLGQSTAITFDEEPWLDEDGIYGFVLSEEGLYNTASVEAAVYLVADEEDYVCLGYTSDVWADWENGVVTDNFDGYWFSLPDGQCLCVYLIEECDGYDLFTAPVEVNGVSKNLRFAWDYETGAVQILDLWDGIDENGFASRPGESLMPGDVIVPLYDAVSSYTGEEFLYYGEEFVWEAGDELGFDMLFDGDYLYAFCINDIFGGCYMTDYVSFSVDGDEILYTAA